MWNGPAVLGEGVHRGPMHDDIGTWAAADAWIIIRLYTYYSHITRYITPRRVRKRHWTKCVRVYWLYCCVGSVCDVTFCCVWDREVMTESRQMEPWMWQNKIRTVYRKNNITFMAYDSYDAVLFQVYLKRKETFWWVSQPSILVDKWPLSIIRILLLRLLRWPCTKA